MDCSKDGVITFHMGIRDERIAGRLVQRQWRADLGAYGGWRSRQGFFYDAFIPDPIADLNPVLPGDVAQAVVEAEHAVRTLNQGPAVQSLEAGARYLLRAESVASSQIEGLRITQRRLAEALFAPDLGDVTARSVINNITAMEAAVNLGSAERPIMMMDIQAIHQTLLNTPEDAAIAGVVRTTQNWIGGRTTSPLGAQFIPPPPEEIAPLLDDLCVFINRDDLPAVAQAAITHAQFETIHPFADGNGRVGRCLIHVVLRRRGLADRYVPPISVVLATNSRAYIGGLNDYRKGTLAEWCGLFAAATRTAAHQAQQLTGQLADLEAQWWARAGRPRRDSATTRLLALLPAIPVLSIQTAATALRVTYPAARQAVENMEKAGVLNQITIGKRNRAWVAKEVFTLLNAFEWDIATPDDPDQERRPSPTRGRDAH